MQYYLTTNVVEKILFCKSLLEEEDIKELQEKFNQIYRGLKSQDWLPSVYECSCKYRHPDGLKCSIGFLIKDEDYSENLEGHALRSVNNYTNYNAEQRRLLSILGFNPDMFINNQTLYNRKIEPLHLIQWVHDGCSSGNKEELKQKVHQYANLFELTIPD